MEFLESPSLLNSPSFLPDATLGVVRSLDVVDLQQCKVEGLVMNAFHLMQRPGSTTIRSLGGLHKMTGWNGLILTDSGGFQAYSLIRENPRNGSITDKGIIFRPESSQEKLIITPEKTIQNQIRYGADIVVCLDDCTHPDAPHQEQVDSVKRTIAWAERCHSQFHQIIAQLEGVTPKLYAVIQGGRSYDLRRDCATALLELGFDGYGFGGWPIENDGNLLADMIMYIRELVPKDYPLHALGVGHPKNLVKASLLGWQSFDSALPTRDARHGRLYILTETGPLNFSETDWFDTLYINDKRHIKTDRPIFDHCDCPCCLHYSLGYLHHLYKIQDTLYFRLATLHNLRYMTRLCEMLQGK